MSIFFVPVGGDSGIPRSAADSRTNRIFYCRREVAMMRSQQKCQAWWRTWEGFRVALLRALSVWVA
jgi:hypothetical protein